VISNIFVKKSLTYTFKTVKFYFSFRQMPDNEAKAISAYFYIFLPFSTSKMEFRSNCAKNAICAPRTSDSKLEPHLSGESFQNTAKTTLGPDITQKVNLALQHCQIISCWNEKAIMSQVKNTRQDSGPAGLIFIVDDDALLAELAGTVLKAEGYAVQSFTDPKDVLKAMQAADPKPVALVTDYEMGAMNGLDLIVSLHKIYPPLKTVLLSGTIDGSFIANHPAKVNKFLGKPYLPAQLKSMVGELLRA
jgi:CheY-like chemotaxis protein